MFHVYVFTVSIAMCLVTQARSEYIHIHAWKLALTVQQSVDCR